MPYILFSRQRQEGGGVLSFQLRTVLVWFVLNCFNSKLISVKLPSGSTLGMHQVLTSTLSDVYRMRVLVTNGSQFPTVPSTDGCSRLPIPTFTSWEILLLHHTAACTDFPLVHCQVSIKRMENTTQSDGLFLQETWIVNKKKKSVLATKHKSINLLFG